MAALMNPLENPAGGGALVAAGGGALVYVLVAGDEPAFAEGSESAIWPPA
jgi:hypothetical protein